MKIKRKEKPIIWTPSGEKSDKVAEYIREWGGSASIALLDPACEHFVIPNCKGMIGYRTESNCAVVLGDPVCAPSHKADLVHSFHDYCKENGKNIIYTTTSERFAYWAMQNGCSALVQVGDELISNPQHDPLEGSSGRKLRNKISHCIHAGITVEEYTTEDKELEAAIMQVGDSWRKGRQGPQIYLAGVNLFAHRSGKRWFYARQGKRVVGVLLLNQLKARKGWLLNLLLATPDAPHGTTELLVVSALEVLRREKCHYISFGTTPADQIGEIIGLGTLSSWIARIAFVVAKTVFRLDARKKYWKKFHPQSERSYLLFSQPQIGLREIKSMMSALNVSL